MKRPKHEFEVTTMGTGACCRKCGIWARPYVEVGPKTKGYVTAVLRVENAAGLRVPPSKVGCRS